MNIREISDVFKDTASGITALKSYNFGWASDRVRQGNTEDYQELNEFPRVFFSVPTITASDQTRKQDTYQVTLFFDDLLGYDNEGDADLTLQIDKWALLQNYATAFIQRLNLIKQSILPNYLFIPEPPQFTFDSFVGIQRLVTVQVNFNLVVPTNCEVTVQRIINVVGNALASGVASGNLFRSTNVTGTATATAFVFADLTVGGQNIVELFAEVFANGNVTANITRALNLNANVVTDSTVNASPIIALNLTGNSTATGNVNALPTIIKNLTATATAEASVNAELTVTTQGVVLLEASVTATGTATGEIFRSVTLQSSSNTTAETTATATLTKVLEATATATAQSDANAQLTIPVNASATATAETSANAQLSYTVNASATATAETSAEAQIVRIISASATAMAESSAEASFGVTFAANVEGTATVDNATIARAATMVASVTGEATVTNATLDVTAAFDTDAQAFFTRVTTAGGTLSETEQSAVNTLVTSLKSNGLWTKMKAIYPMVGASAAACAQNLKSASFTATFSSGWTFASSGVTPNGTSSFMNTGLNGTNLTNNNHSLLFYSRSNVNAPGFQIGATNNGSFSLLTAFRIRNSGNFNGFSQMSADTPLLIVTNGTSQGMCLWSKVSSTSARGYMNTSILGTLSNASTGNITSLTNNFYIGALNIGGTAAQFSTNQCAFASIGDGLNDTDASNFYTLIQAFQTTLNRNV